MDRVYLSASTTTGVNLGKITYWAEIRENGYIIEKMHGKYNTKEALDVFINSYWPGDLGRHPVKPYEVELTLKIRQYIGARLNKVVVQAKMPRPFFCNFGSG